MGMISNEHVDQYIRHLGGLHRAERTIQGYRAELEALVRRGLPTEKEEVGRAIDLSLTGEPLAPRSRNRRLAVVRGFFRFLNEEGVVSADPTEGIRRSPIKRRERVALVADDLRKVTAVLESLMPSWRRTRDTTILAIFFYTGLRVGELHALNVDQVDLGGQVLRATRRKGGSMIDVLLSPQAVEVLQEWLAVRPESPEPSLFIGSRRTRLSIRMIEKKLERLGKAADLAIPLHPHALRRAHATALQQVGVSLDVIRLSLNHALITTTVGYLYTDEKQLREALAKLPSLKRSK